MRYFPVIGIFYQYHSLKIIDIIFHTSHDYQFPHYHSQYYHYTYKSISIGNESLSISFPINIINIISFPINTIINIIPQKYHYQYHSP